MSSFAPDRLPQSCLHDSHGRRNRILAPSQLNLKPLGSGAIEQKGKDLKSRLKAFYPDDGFAIFCTFLTSVQATILCLYVHVGKDSMGYVKSFQTFHHPAVPRSLRQRCISACSMPPPAAALSEIRATAARACSRPGTSAK